MTRDAFMRELEYLLQDVQDDEKEEALQYYRDYFDEAGPENEEQVIREFGSPERVAAIIRSDLAGNLEEGGAFTESGYTDERFRDPGYHVAHRYDLPESAGGKEAGRTGETGESGKKSGTADVQAVKNRVDPGAAGVSAPGGLGNWPGTVGTCRVHPGAADRAVGVSGPGHSGVPYCRRYYDPLGDRDGLRKPLERPGGIWKRPGPGRSGTFGAGAVRAVLRPVRALCDPGDRGLPEPFLPQEQEG